MVKYLFDLHTPVPAQPNCLRAFCLFQPSEIQLQVFVVHIDRRNSWHRPAKSIHVSKILGMGTLTRIFDLEVLVGVEDWGALVSDPSRG